MQELKIPKDILIRQKANFARKMISTSIILIAALSVAYFAFWVVVLADSVILDYMGSFFTPLATFLNPNNIDNSIYQKTSFELLAFILPLVLSYVAVDKYEEGEIKKYTAQEEMVKKEIARQKRIYEKIKYQTNQGKYSICLSVDYNSEKYLTDNLKQKLNNAIYTKIYGIAKGIANTNVFENRALVVTSSSYEKYDLTYSLLLKTLSVIKKLIESRYSLSLIPSITTDIDENLNIKDIVEKHFDIHSSNLQNRAVTTAEFEKRYTTLKNNKYTSIPIGEFMSNSEPKSYELNLVYKDLNKTLAALK